LLAVYYTCVVSLSVTHNVLCAYTFTIDVMTKCIGFNIPLDTCHFGDETFQVIDCTGTDNQTITKRKYT